MKTPVSQSMYRIVHLYMMAVVYRLDRTVHLYMTGVSGIDVDCTCAHVQGTFAMVVTSNGNTDGFCIGTGVPYRTRSNTALNPYNPAFGNLFGNSFTGNPFGQLFSQGQ